MSSSSVGVRGLPQDIEVASYVTPDNEVAKLAECLRCQWLGPVRDAWRHRIAWARCARGPLGR